MYIYTYIQFICSYTYIYIYIHTYRALHRRALEEKAGVRRSIVNMSLGVGTPDLGWQMIFEIYGPHETWIR